MPDSDSYRERKRFFDGLLTIYGRNTVLEALRHPHVEVFRLHLSDTNRPTAALDQLVALARNKGAEVLTHSRRELSRISTNGRQDQGVAADLRLEGYRSVDDYLRNLPQRFTIVALDRVTNPQNLGMVIRSVAAAPGTELLISGRGGASIGPLAIKASAGAVFRASILVSDSLTQTIDAFISEGAHVAGMTGHGKMSITEFEPAARQIFLLGSESSGVSAALLDRCDTTLRIPMERSVESLNVGVAAALVAFLPVLRNPPGA